MAPVNQVSLSFRWQTAYWATTVGAVMVLSGFGLLLLGWRGLAALLLVPLQVPYGVSGGLGGLALIGFGALLLNLQVGRHLAARERARSGAAVRQAVHLLVLARAAQATVDASGSSTS